ncbi:MAG: phosphoribosylglycinamide formyltransferase [Alphaproteobacteria bacterium]|nr:phosphoribosylglycinamide formyltransferase [Alphaproteobacteria bacterium]MDE2337431.1 phosphoribosylglycinamide formyltransferase [Alphaproteobacteria bacterium]
MTAAVLASGGGSNAENILRHARTRAGGVEIPLVICDKAGAPVIGRAEKLGADCKVIERTGTKAEHEAAIIAALEEYGIEWIFLAGYMAILSPAFVALYKNRIVNIHPSLLPQFPGKDGYGDAFRAGVITSGVTLHYVDAGVDTGPVIAQKTFPREEGDTLETFRARGMQLEYELYREFIDSLAKRAAA